ncbi:hypothetical protein CVT24_001690 [Panaeolus cyanescens]|uniref:Phosphatidate cytidylyltransferase n=1 Tax=Panaeolus cyanescens TaxID=181874 RepID=A0A409YFM8_9AGAR|nr:hypothetical protein CVT24_001690 [Panaeolus cyanescens]
MSSAVVIDRDTATSTHDSPSSIRRSSRPARSPSLTRSTTSTRSSKRSPSPIISFHPAPLSAENPKGVKNITRKVIRRLEGLGHLESVDMDLSVPEEDESYEARNGEEAEVERALYAMAKDAINTAKRQNGGHHHSPSSSSSALTNGKEPKAAKQKVDYEIPRKLLHSSIGFFTLYLYISESDPRNVVWVLWMALTIIAPADLLRFRSQRFERTYERVLGFLMRESEKNSVNGVIWYILGVNFVLSLYPQDIATIAILILSWADTAASTIGRMYGALTPKLPSHLPVLGLPLAPRKSLAGFAAAVITGACITFGFWTWIGPLRPDASTTLSWTWEEGIRLGGNATASWTAGALGLLVISAAAGLVSGVAEALDLGSVDDNLTLPIISGGCIYALLKAASLIGSWLSS